MELLINGEKKTVEAHTVADVIDSFGLQAKMVVVELNGLIIQREVWGMTELQSGMKMEIVHFVGGG